MALGPNIIFQNEVEDDIEAQKKLVAENFEPDELTIVSNKSKCSVSSIKTVLGLVAAFGTGFACRHVLLGGSNGPASPKLTLPSIFATTKSEATQSLLIIGTDNKNEHKSYKVNGASNGPAFITFGKGTEVVDSCSVAWNNEQYVFGGQTNKRQISKIEDCELTQVGELDFDFSSGACDVTDKHIVLCFGNDDDTKTCRYGLDPFTITSALPQSNFGHRYTRIATGQNNILAIGGCEVCDGSDFHSESELFDFETEQWTPTEAEFDWNILFAAPVVWSDGFYVFGGQTGLGQRDASDEIYRLGNRTWVEVGKLETARFGHGVVATEEGFHVFGGDSTERIMETQDTIPVPSEFCQPGLNDSWSCISPKGALELNGLFNYPEIFIVSPDTCNA